LQGPEGTHVPDGEAVPPYKRGTNTRQQTVPWVAHGGLVGDCDAWGEEQGTRVGIRQEPSGRVPRHSPTR